MRQCVTFSEGSAFIFEAWQYLIVLGGCDKAVLGLPKARFSFCTDRQNLCEGACISFLFE